MLRQATKRNRPPERLYGVMTIERVGASARRDERAEFCRAEHPRLVGAMCLYTGDVALAEELAQEALARACRQWSEVTAMASPGAWVHRVAINLANSHFRRTLLERRARQHLAGSAVEGRASDLTTAIAVRTAVAALPRRQRTAIVLRYFVDLPVADVAHAMGCREGTVRALTSQAIAALRDTHLLDIGDVPDER